MAEQKKHREYPKSTIGHQDDGRLLRPQSRVVEDVDPDNQVGIDEANDPDDEGGE